MGTTIGSSLDYFLTGTNVFSSTTLLTDLQVIDTNTVLADNEPLSATQTLVVFGRPTVESGQSVEGRATHLVLGAFKVQEDYDVHGYIQILTDGPDQKTARDKALAVWNAILHWIYGDLTLGGILQDGRSLIDADVLLIQTRDTDDTGGGDQRFAEIDFTFHIANHYVP